MRRWDGSIQSANTPTYDKTGISREDFGIYRCMIVDVLYADDERNISKNGKNPEVLYECVILGGSGSGQTISFCRLASYLDGDNYSERTLKKTTKDISKIKLQDHDGDIVYVQFNQGHDAYPIITGMARGINQKVAAKKADGPRFIESFNGIETNIDNKGNRTTTAKGGKTDNGSFTSGTSAIITEVWDAANEKLTRTYKSGMVVTEDGKGNKISIKAGATELEIDGSSGKISLKSEMIDLGSGVSDFVTMFTELSSAFNQHMHPFTDITPGGPVPSMTQPPSAPLLSSVGSQTVKVQP